MSATVFILSLFFIVYAYLGYPALLLIISRIRSRTVLRADIRPDVSFIITAYNEEARIGEKIRNTRALDYPKEKLEVIVASDCSTDRTDEIVRSHEESGVRLVRAPERRGKEAGQRLAVEAAAGDILIFSDVATILEPDAVTNIVKNFADPTVGCVSSVDRFINSDGTVSGEGAYVRYEMFLRSLETSVNSLVGLSGSLFAARREVCRDWADDLQSDFNTLLNAIRLGMRGISDPHSIGYYRSISDEKKEFDRKVRTVLRGISVFMRSLPLLNPLRYGLFSWQLLSHKLCRWLVPFAMIGLFLSNAALCLLPSAFSLQSSTSTLTLTSSSTLTFFRLFFLAQVGFYLIAGLGNVSSLLQAFGLLRLPYFFVLVNASILSAWLRYLRGERMVSWQPSKR